MHMNTGGGGGERLRANHVLVKQVKFNWKILFCQHKHAHWIFKESSSQNIILFPNR